MTSRSEGFSPSRPPPTLSLVVDDGEDAVVIWWNPVRRADADPVGKEKSAPMSPRDISRCRTLMVNCCWLMSTWAFSRKVTVSSSVLFCRGSTSLARLLCDRHFLTASPNNGFKVKTKFLRTLTLIWNLPFLFTMVKWTIFEPLNRTKILFGLHCFQARTTGFPVDKLKCHIFQLTYSGVYRKGLFLTAHLQ